MSLTGAASGSDCDLRPPADHARSADDGSGQPDSQRERGYKLSRYIVVTDSLTIDRKIGARVVFSTRSGINAFLPERTWGDLATGNWDAIPADSLTDLMRSQIVVAASENELQSVIRENETAIRDSRELEQVIQPSAACQLGCSYCGQKHQALHMSEHIQDKLIERVGSRLMRARHRGAAYEALNIGWFGAEPLLGIRAMRRLSPLLKELAGAHGAGYHARIVTNGLRLTLEIARELEDLHRVGHVEVTLDGPAAMHDERRFTKSGRPTFDRILRNLLAVAREPDLEFKLAIRCNVDERNADAVPELISLLASEEVQGRIGLYFSPIYAWGNDADRTALDPRDYASREVAWFSQMIESGYNVDLLPERRRIVCLAVRPDARVTDALGAEFNCTEVPYVPSYGTPNRYSTGDVFGHASAEPFFRSFNDEIESSAEVWCHSCQLLPVCGGACPKAWSDGNPPCPSHKRNIKDRVLLNFARSRIQAQAGPGPETGPARAPSDRVASGS